MNFLVQAVRFLKFLISHFSDFFSQIGYLKEHAIVYQSVYKNGGNINHQSLILPVQMLIYNY